MNSALLSRYAESIFWLARYVERAQSLARVLEVQTSFQRGRPVQETSWAWIIALFSDERDFFEKHAEASAANVIYYYVKSLDNPHSIMSAIRAVRENARALRPLISTDMWYQVNSFYTRLMALSESDFTEVRLSRTCDVIKHGCYSQIGVAHGTLYRDESWPFFRLGLAIERADQTSRLLDVQFARQQTGANGASAASDFGFWTLLLRAASAYHAYRRIEPRNITPQAVAKFLIFNGRFPRSLAFCINEAQLMVNQLRTSYRLRLADPVLEEIELTNEALQSAAHDEELLSKLHAFNDFIQLRLIALTDELSHAFFGHPNPAAASRQQIASAR